MPFSYDININESGRAKRRLNPETINTKAGLGSNIGDLARGTAVFDPDAYDGDEDGLVQDGTPFERPAVLSNIASVARGGAGFASRGKWGESFDNWTVGKTNKEIAEIVVPDNAADLIAYVNALTAKYGHRGFRNPQDALYKLGVTTTLPDGTTVEIIDFSPETVARLRELIEKALDDTQGYGLREIIDSVGIPPMVVDQNPDFDARAIMSTHTLMMFKKSFVMDPNSSIGKSGVGKLEQTKNMRGWLEQKFGENILKNVFYYDSEDVEGLVGNATVKETFIHEYGHFLHSVAIDNHPDPKVREELWLLYHRPWYELESDTKVRLEIRNLAHNVVYADTVGRQSVSIEPPSMYSLTDGAELIAELFLKYMKLPDGQKGTIDKKQGSLLETIIPRPTSFASRSIGPSNNGRAPMTAREIAELVVPDNAQDAMELLEEWGRITQNVLGYEEFGRTDLTGAERAQITVKRMFYHIMEHGTSANPKLWDEAIKRADSNKKYMSPDEVFDFSPEIVEAARAMVEEALTTQPLMLEHANIFGMPPVLVSLNEKSDTMGIHQSGLANIIVLNPVQFTGEQEGSWKALGTRLKGTEWFLAANGKAGPVSVFTHEYGHYINDIAAQIHPDRESRYLAGWYNRGNWEEVNPGGIKGFRYRRAHRKFKKQNPGFVSDTADKRWLQSPELEKAINRGDLLDWDNGPPHVLSEYGQSAPVEMFAEGYQAFVSGDPEMEARVSPTLRKDIEMIVGRAPRPTDSRTIAIYSVPDSVPQALERRVGFASLSITRDSNGTRDMAKAMNGEDNSPLDGANWLEKATIKEIAQALVPRSREDAVNLVIQNILTGNRNPDPHAMQAVIEFVEDWLDHDLFDFSPSGVAKMQEFLENTLNESPSFLWQVRKFGSLPFMLSDRKNQQNYIDNARNGIPTLVPSYFQRRQRIDFTNGTQMTRDGETWANQGDYQRAQVASVFDMLVTSRGTMGFTMGNLFMVINANTSQWKAYFEPSTRKPPKYGMTRRVQLGLPNPQGGDTLFPLNDSKGRLYISNFSTSVEGTIVHEWHHGWFGSLFGLGALWGYGIKQIARKQGLGASESSVLKLGGDRKDRYKYFFPNLPQSLVEKMFAFAKENLSINSTTMVGGSGESISRFLQNVEKKLNNAVQSQTLSALQKDEIDDRINDYFGEIVMTAFARYETVVPGARQAMIMLGADPTDVNHVEQFLEYKNFNIVHYGFDPVRTETFLFDLATDYPDVFGDPRVPIAQLPGQYSQSMAQESWAELGTVVNMPDKDFRNMFLTSKLMGMFLYLMGEQNDPYDDPVPMAKPWEQPGLDDYGDVRGFASRSQRVTHARETVPKRASNSMGNVVSTATPNTEKNTQRIVAVRNSNGHTDYRAGDYQFTIPGDRYKPDLSTAYTQWASESHFDMQQASAMMMGLQPSEHRPARQVGNTAVNALIYGLPMETPEYREMQKEMRSLIVNTQRMLDELRDADTHSSLPLYHTLTSMRSDDKLMSANVGDEVYLPLASFTPLQIDSADIPIYAPEIGTNGSPVVLKLAIGARVIESTLLDNVNHNEEWRDVPIESITGGRFRIASRGERNGVPFVEIEHSDIFDTNAGEFVNVDPAKATSSIKDMVIVDRGIREIEALNRDRSFIAKDDPRYGVLTDEMDLRAHEVVLSMFGNNIQPPNPITNLSPEKQQQIIDEMPVIRAIPISSMDKRNLPGFISSQSDFGFDRIIRPERNVSRASARMLEENREFIKERQIIGTNDRVLDDSWITGTIERMEGGEITHVDAMDTMSVAVEVVRDRVRNQPSVDGATNGEIYNYQKLGKRLRQAMLVEVNDEDIDSQPLRRSPVGFASSSSRTNTKISEPFNPTLISTEASDAEWGQFESGRTIVQAVVYDIDGEKVVFGVEERHGLDTTGIKVIPLNPYEITGLDRDSEEGQETALDWLYASLAAYEDADYNNRNDTEISALLYSATKGDEESKKKFKEYAQKGREIAQQRRQQALDEESERIDSRMSDRQVASDVRYMQERLAFLRKKKKEGYISTPSKEEIDDAKITPYNLVLVRWSEFPPEYDADGNVILQPASEYVAVDRQTMHFTLNHSVEEHMFWNDGGGEGYLIMTTLGDVLEANGVESLDNLYGVDTYFTPKPGEGLKLPKSKVVKVSKGEDRKAITARVVEEEFDSFEVAGGPHYSGTAGFDDTLRIMARDLGIVPGGLHANRPHHALEQMNNYLGDSESKTRDLRPEKNNSGPYVEDIAEMEKNALLRLADRRHAPWSGVNDSTVKNPAGSFASSSRGSSRRMSAGLNNPEQIKVVDSLQERIGFASRSDAVDPRGKDLEEVAKELELTELEKRELAKLLPNFENIEEYKFHPSITPEQRRKIIDSIRVRIDDGVPYLTIDGHPFLVDEIPDKRDWSTVVAPSEEQQKLIAKLIRKLGLKAGKARFDRPNNMGLTLEEEDRARQHIDLNIVAFGQWAVQLYNSIGAKYPVLDDSDLDRSNMPNIPGGFIWNSGIGLYLNAISGLLQRGIVDYFGEDDFLNAHDLWGHIATGRSFDRHGEWANALAIWSMMDRWAEENNISESDLLRVKLKWMNDTEFDRFSFRRFGLGRDDEEDYETLLAMHRVVDSGMATDEEIKELLALIDHGRVAESANAKKLVDATQEERAEIVKTDIVRQTLRQRLGFASRSTSIDRKTVTEVSEELELNDEELKILLESELLEDIEDITSGELEKRPIHARLEAAKKRLLSSIRIEVSDDGIPMIMADPNPLIFEFIPDKRDWSKVRVPKRATVKAAAKHIKENQSEEMLRRDYGDAEEIFYRRLLSLLESTREGSSEEDIDVVTGESPGTGWLFLYLQALSNPGRGYELPTSKPKIDGAGNSEDVHDAFGHVGIGRGFDRHGEWANPLAIITMLDLPEFDDFTPEQKDSVKRSIMDNFAMLRIEQTYGTGFGENYDEDMDSGDWGSWIFRYTGDIQTVIDMLDDSDRAQVLNNDGSPKADRPTAFASMSSSPRSDISAIAQQDLTHAKNNPGFASRSGVEKSAKSQVVPENERSAARKAKELIANGGSNEEIEKAIEEAFTGVLVGMKDYKDNRGINRGNKFNMVPRSVTVTDTEDGRKRIEITGRVISKHLGEYDVDFNEDDILGNFSRVMYFDKDSAEVLHTDMAVNAIAQKSGIATALNARNEEIYRELGISSISLFGSSQSQGTNGASHWPRNGYYWYDEDAKNTFLDLISEDLENALKSIGGAIERRAFKKETQDRIEALISKARKDKFGEGVTPEELLAWDDKGKALRGAEIRYRRDISKPSPTSFASRSSDFKPNKHDIEIDLKAPDADMFEANEKGETIQVFVPIGVEVVHPRTGKKVNLNTQEESSDFVEFGGDLSKVPDTHLAEAILTNTESVDGDDLGGFRLMKPGGRFTSAGGTSGKAGMLQFIDKKTGAVFGIKFESGFGHVIDENGNRSWSVIPLQKFNDDSSQREISLEIMIQGLLSFFGFEPSATRVIGRSKFGSGLIERENLLNSPESARRTRALDARKVLPGLAMIMEFAQNRNPKVRGLDGLTREDEVDKKIRPISILRVAFVDAIIQNLDRNSGNMLLAEQSDGTSVIIPIDHGLTAQGLRLNMENNTEFLKNHFLNLLSNLGYSLRGDGRETMKGIFRDMSRKELETLIAEAMTDFRQVQYAQQRSLIKTMEQAINKMVDLKDEQGMYANRRAKEMDLAFLLQEQERTINLIFERINFLSNMSDSEIADSILEIVTPRDNNTSTLYELNPFQES